MGNFLGYNGPDELWQPTSFEGPTGAEQAYSYSPNRTFRYSDPSIGGSGMQKYVDAAWTPYKLNGPHEEANTYLRNGLLSNQYAEAERDQAVGTADELDLARLRNPEAVGQAISRTEQSLTGGSNEDDYRQELAFYSPSVRSTLSGYTPAMEQQIQQQLNASTPAAQASRNKDSGFGGLGALAMLAAAIYSGGAALGAWGTGAGVGGLTAAELTAADMAAGLLPEYGSLAGTAGATGLTGGGAMDWADLMSGLGDTTADLGSIASDVGGGLSQIASQAPSYVDSFLNNPNIWPDFTNYTGQMSVDPSLLESLTTAPMNFSASLGAGAQSLWDKFLQDPMSTAGKTIAKSLGVTDKDGNLDLSKILAGIYGGVQGYRGLQSASQQANDMKLATSMLQNKNNQALAPSNWKSMTQAAQPVRRAHGGLVQYAGGGGQDDDVPAMLSDGEYVFDADTVSALGDGNNEAGAAALDQMREHIRMHKRSAPESDIPPKAKDPMQYLKGAR